jgi:hypothetical protein
VHVRAVRINLGARWRPVARREARQHAANRCVAVARDHLEIAAGIVASSASRRRLAYGSTSKNLRRVNPASSVASALRAARCRGSRLHQDLEADLGPVREPPAGLLQLWVDPLCLGSCLARRHDDQ